jgi:hypothetical protein
MSTQSFIQKNTIQKYLSETFSSNELSYYLQYNDFSAFLNRMNQDESFDSDLTQQLFDRMVETTKSPKPTMSVFPKIYIQAIASLDKKIDFQKQQIQGLEGKVEYIEQTMKSLKGLKRKNKLPYKKQV